MGQGAELRDDARDPVHCGFAVDRDSRSEQLPAALEILLCEDHRHAGAGGDDGGLQARGPSADNQQVAVSVDRFVACRIG